jgi:hypothetical protein
MLNVVWTPTAENDLEDILDWIRVVTAAPVPVPAAAWMGLFLMGGLGLFRKLRPTG